MVVAGTVGWMPWMVGIESPSVGGDREAILAEAGSLAAARSIQV